jgi:peptidoglycan glycosyltransferase
VSGQSPTPPRIASSLVRLSLALAIAYGALAAGLTWWQVVQAQQLSSDPLNPLVIQATRQAPRGTIYAAGGEALAKNVNSGGTLIRDYPYPVVAPVIGYDSGVFGTAGLERAYDAQLIGLATLNPGADLLRKFRTQPYDPSDIYLSLDLQLQQAAADLLGSQQGAVVAIEPSTGRVLALVSSPTFDPNRLVDPTGGRHYMSSLQQDGSSPLLNRATQGLYVPGSVFKIVTAVAGFGSGTINADTTFPDQPAEYNTGFNVDGYLVHDFPRKVQLDHPLNFLEATEVSDNIWYAHAGLQIGPTNLVEWAARLGFGAAIPFDLPTSPSQVTSGGGPFGGFRDQVELANAAYGQAQVLVTPLQMALVAATIANGGVLMQPKLVDELRNGEGSVTSVAPSIWRTVLPPDEAAAITQAMVQAVEGRYGRAFAGGARIDGVQVAGKSGTAELAPGLAPHSWFIGFAPAANPQIAVAVIVEGGGEGAQKAVPLAGTVMADYLGVHQ